VGNVGDIGGMFYDAVSFNQPLERWDISCARSHKAMSRMFYGASSFNQSLDKWNLSAKDTEYVGL
jgi:hypothetical protein